MVFLCFSLQLITARDEVLRLGNELVEKDNRITEYERVLHSQRQWAEREIEAKEEIIQALEKKLEVQGQKVGDARMIKVCSAY